MRKIAERTPAGRPSSASFGARVRVLLGLAVAVCLWVGACSGGHHPPADGNSLNRDASVGFEQEGQPCPTEGATMDCGRVEYTNGNYVTCSIGHAVCQGGKWGACIGDHVVTRSLPNLQLTMHGFRLLAQPMSTACANVCDPYCFQTQPKLSDYSDAAGFQIKDGGLSLVGDAISVRPKGNCVGLQCQIAFCPGNGATTLSGTVYDPAGNVPLYDANVYIPLDAAAPLPPFSSGASCDTCGGAASLEALQAVQTDAFGNFTLNNVPSGTNIPVVVQMGKWRREILLSSITDCVDNSITNNCTSPNPADCVFRLPRNHTDGYDPATGTYSKGDMPQVAIITGGSDPFDCLLLKAGIDPQEVSDYSSSKRIHFYESDTAPGNKLDPAYGANVNGSVLWNSLNASNPNMMSYDIVLLPCEGSAIDRHQCTAGTCDATHLCAGGATCNGGICTGTCSSNGNCGQGGVCSSNPTPYQNLISYTDAGGRSFLTHFSYSWLEYPSGKGYVPAPDNWSTLADWSPTGVGMTGSIDTQDPLTGTVNTGFPKGGVYSQWLQNVGATTVASKLTIHEGRQDLVTIGAGAQGWMTAHDNVYAPAPNYTNLFTFNTPLGAPAANQCGRVVFSDFHVSANALVPGICTAEGTCTKTSDCNGHPCTGGFCTTPTCTKDSDCGTNGPCNAGLCATVSCNNNSNCGIGGVCTNQCINDTDCGFSATCVGSTGGAVGQCSEPCSKGADCPSASYTCAGATQGSCQESPCAKDSDCGSGRTCAALKCLAGTCVTNADCAGGATCNGGFCTGTCTTAANCGTGGVCGGTCTCGGNSDCNGGTCAGMTCSAAVCHTNADCGLGTCGGVGLSGTCKQGTVCHKDTDCGVSGTCGSGPSSTAGACFTNGKVCHVGGDCDSNSCGSGAGSALGKCNNAVIAFCHSAGDCDSGVCGLPGGTQGSCSTLSKSCHANSECDGGICGHDAVTNTGTLGICARTNAFVCGKDTDCDSGHCGVSVVSPGGTNGACSTNGTFCHSDATCDSGHCGVNGGSGTNGICARTNTFVCGQDTDCDSGHCGVFGASGTNGTCSSNGTTCHADATCDSGHCGVNGGTGTNGACARTNVFVCGKDSDCDSGHCGVSGVSPGGTNGACQSNGAFCHADANCDSGHCGVNGGTGTSGICARTNTFVCGQDTDCDSGHCGVSGVSPGGTNGTCQSNGAFCHSDATCDSGHCGVNGGTGTSGICARTNTFVCGQDSDCDSGHCGVSGVSPGGTNGTCQQPVGTVCHANAGCDSGICGGVTKGTCGGAGTCAGAADCKNGAVCTAGHCTGACSLDTDCGTGGAPVCNNAKCNNPAACTGNAACLSTHVCTGAKCSTPAACNGDVACPASGLCGSVGPVTTNDAKCSTAAACTGNAACTVTNTCNGAKCSTPIACNGDVGCPASGLCGSVGPVTTNDAKCSTAPACTGNAACPATNTCNGAKCSTPAACSNDAACPASVAAGTLSPCTGAKCSSAPACNGNAACTVTNICTAAKCSTPAACSGDVGCPASGLCGSVGPLTTNDAKCSNAAACSANAACLVSGACTGAKCSTPAGCNGDVGCPASGVCGSVAPTVTNDAKCSTLKCNGDADCTTSNLCGSANPTTTNDAKCSTPAGCAGDAGCPVSHLCGSANPSTTNDAKCSTATACAGDAGCPSSHVCGSVAPTTTNDAKCSTSVCNGDVDCAFDTASISCTGSKCSAAACATNADCGLGTCGGQCQAFTCTKASDCSSGVCNAGVCACATVEDCGGAQSCIGTVLGACAKACTTNAQCAPDKCVNGQCGGCASSSDCHDNAYAASCAGIPAGNYGACSVLSQGEFPEACRQGTLSSQEKALEFMFFDLTACISPDNLPPPQPVAAHAYPAATFTANFTADCPDQTSPVWREIDWRATIPNTASIVFAAQTGTTALNLTPAIPLPVVTATTSTPGTNYDKGLIDTGTAGTGAFNTVNPQIASQNILRLTITLNPTSDQLGTPTLLQYYITHDCVPSQ